MVGYRKNRSVRYRVEEKWKMGVPTLSERVGMYP